MALTFGIILAAGVGGFVEIAPLFTIDDTVEIDPDMRLYTPLEQAGRDIYSRGLLCLPQSNDPHAAR